MDHDCSRVRHGEGVGVITSVRASRWMSRGKWKTGWGVVGERGRR
eukprot:COSAG04_NODE_26153_length_298_cov_1.552764_1_plen_44_part_01